jgi:hypothetical protein
MTKDDALRGIEYALKQKLFGEISNRIKWWEDNESSFEIILNNLGVFSEEAKYYQDALTEIKKEK